jgi:cytochrome c oxidase subunit III
MRAPRVVGNVADLPTVTFGHRSMMWWGTLGFIVIEGSTLVICALSYAYVRRNFPSWPSGHVAVPALLIPTIQAAVMLVSNIPMVWVDRSARRMNLQGVRIGMVVASFFAVAMTLLRWFEFQALRVRWDSNAYGSAAWATLTAHGSLLLLQLLETIAFTALLLLGPVEQRDLAGASDNALYWYFITLAWIPLYGLIFLSPYIV